VNLLNFTVYYKPTKSNILIYDSHSIRFARVLFKKNNFPVFHARRDGLSIYIFLKTLFKTGIINLFDNYKKNFFKFVNPKIIYTSIDNNIGFYKLKKLFPKAIYVADQNGMRDNKFYNLSKSVKQPRKDLNVDIFFCFGENEKKRLKKVINAKIYPLGNTLNNSKKFSEIKYFKFLNVVFISSLKLSNSQKELKTFKNLSDICKKKKVKLFFLDRRRFNFKNFLIKKMRNKPFNYLSNKKFSIKNFQNNSIFVFSHSTLGYEFLSKGFRIACFSQNYLNHFIKGKYNTVGPFWSNSNDKKSLNSLLNKVSNKSNKRWKFISKKYSNQLLKYDKNNLSKIEIIYKFLK